MSMKSLPKKDRPAPPHSPLTHNAWRIHELTAILLVVIANMLILLIWKENDRGVILLSGRDGRMVSASDSQPQGRGFESCVIQVAHQKLSRVGYGWWHWCLGPLRHKGVSGDRQRWQLYLDYLWCLEAYKRVYTPQWVEQVMDVTGVSGVIIYLVIPCDDLEGNLTAVLEDHCCQYWSLPDGCLGCHSGTMTGQSRSMFGHSGGEHNGKWKAGLVCSSSGSLGIAWSNPLTFQLCSWFPLVDSLKLWAPNSLSGCCFNITSADRATEIFGTWPSNIFQILENKISFSSPFNGLKVQGLESFPLV